MFCFFFSRRKRERKSEKERFESTLFCHNKGKSFLLQPQESLA